MTDFPVSVLPKRKKFNLTLLTVFLALLFPAWPAFAGSDGDECTLFGAAGCSVKDGGTVVLKNRDRNTRFLQSFDCEKPEKGFAFFGIRNLEFANKNNYSYTMGMNEKGFICVTSSAPKKINFEFGDEEFHVVHPGMILKEVDSVDSFIEKYVKGRKFQGSMNYIAADSKKLCMVEVVDKDHYDYKIIMNGTLAHTNHYYMDAMKRYQYLPLNKSSEARLKRAEMLLKSAAGPLGPEDFMRFSKDHATAGIPSDLTICRHPDMGLTPSKFDGGTISSMVFIAGTKARPCAYVCIGQPCANNFFKVEFNKDGGININALEMAFLSTGIINSTNDLKRDSLYHFAGPFINSYSGWYNNGFKGEGIDE